jgi:hypothetical protein
MAFSGVNLDGKSVCEVSIERHPIYERVEVGSVSSNGFFGGIASQSQSSSNELPSTGLHGSR